MILKLKEKLIKLPHPDFFLKVKDIFSPVKKHTIEITKKQPNQNHFENNRKDQELENRLKKILIGYLLQKKMI